MGKIIVGGVIKKDNKYLLVQEGQKSCKGKWNIPAGHLDPNENIFEGAKREILEECGYEVEITGIAEIANRVVPDTEILFVVFSTNVIGGEARYDGDEILDIKWCTYEDVISMHDELRSYDLIVNAITAVEENNITDKELIKVVK